MATITFTAEPGKQELVITRLFDAPPEKVFKAMSDPALIPQWWGPASFTTTVERLDAQPGGTWRFIQRDPQGNVYAFHGVYHTVIPAQLVIDTFEFEGMPGHVLMETITYKAQDRGTRVTNISVFQSVEDRDGMFQTGMAKGAIESGERMAALLKTLQR